MNERIQQLAEEAELYAVSDNSSMLFDVWKKRYTEKLAELIVRECANRVSGMVVMDKGYIPQDPHSQGWNAAVAYAGKELKKYFGVES